MRSLWPLSMQAIKPTRQTKIASQIIGYSLNQTTKVNSTSASTDRIRASQGVKWHLLQSLQRRNFHFLLNSKCLFKSSTKKNLKRSFTKVSIKKKLHHILELWLAARSTQKYIPSQLRHSVFVVYCLHSLPLLSPWWQVYALLVSQQFLQILSK